MKDKKMKEQSVTKEWVKDTAQWMTGTPDASFKSMMFLLRTILKKLGIKENG